MCTWEDILQKSSSNVTSATMKEISQLYWTLDSNTIVISVISKQLLQVGLNVTELRNMREFLQNMLGLKIFVWVPTSPFAQILPPCILRNRFDSFMLQKFLSDSVLLVLKSQLFWDAVILCEFLVNFFVLLCKNTDHNDTLLYVVFLVNLSWLL